MALTKTHRRMIQNGRYDIRDYGNVTLPAGDSYGVRYDELWVFIISAL